jgi:hypothetical protein
LKLYYCCSAKIIYIRIQIYKTYYNIYYKTLNHIIGFLEELEFSFMWKHLQCCDDVSMGVLVLLVLGILVAPVVKVVVSDVIIVWDDVVGNVVGMDVEDTVVEDTGDDFEVVLIYVLVDELDFETAGRVVVIDDVDVAALVVVEVDIGVEVDLEILVVVVDVIGTGTQIDPLMVVGSVLQVIVKFV